MRSSLLVPIRYEEDHGGLIRYNVLDARLISCRFYFPVEYTGYADIYLAAYLA